MYWGLSDISLCPIPVCLFEHVLLCVKVCFEDIEYYILWTKLFAFFVVFLQFRAGGLTENGKNRQEKLLKNWKEEGKKNSK